MVIGTENEASNRQSNQQVAYLIPDLNLNISSTYFEDDTIVEVVLQTSVGLDHSIDEDINEENEDEYGDVNANEELPQPSSHVNRLKTLSNGERQAIYNMLQKQSFNGKFKQGVTRMIASQFSVSMRTVQRIWKQSGYGGTHANVSHRKTRNCGRKRVQINLEQIRENHLHRRTTLCSLSLRLKSGQIRRHSSTIKPFLMEENKRSRLQFCLSMLDSNSMPHDPTFIGMYNTVHIDEKWFWMTTKSENYYLLPNEEQPLRTCKSKNFIEKMMFLAAIARPRFDAEGNELFSGKISVFPFVAQEPAKRTSVNRVAGTMETKLIPSMKREIIRSFLIENDSRCPIFIQQNNARTHVDHNDNLFFREAAKGGFDIRLMSQPPNSPDLNILDLGFLRLFSPCSIRSRSFQAFEVTKSNRIFLTVQACMVEIVRAKGSMKYKIPHIKKTMLERAGQLPTQLKCDPKLVQ
ncbi:hypothetical protein ABFS83_04G123300 [Erythranthe nasuta]